MNEWKVKMNEWKVKMNVTCEGQEGGEPVHHVHQAWKCQATRVKKNCFLKPARSHSLPSSINVATKVKGVLVLVKIGKFMISKNKKLFGFYDFEYF